MNAGQGDFFGLSEYALVCTLALCFGGVDRVQEEKAGGREVLLVSECPVLLSCVP